MPRMKMAAKHTRRERPPSISSEDEDPQANRIDRCPVLIGKNVDPASFTFDAPSFNIENIFIVLSSTRPKALPYGMILTKVFEHFGVSVHDSVALLPKATDTINTLTLKRMKIFKKDGQWVAKSKGLTISRDPLRYHSRVKKWMMMKMSRR
ncbi:hypothetical protein Adt_22876 [Abeliophyllum distichum]|uniref:Uncharacterized protein n=1 Tax=Abeliophyllum distichum TaxID=126358 RepID=A0ABD1SA25_9LAMI